jgi:pimeloyl-ACP methyl ester carboxylesterase
MEAIRAALGEEQLTYVGFSYGTLLGALYAETYPERVRAMVLDGALDPSLSSAEVTAIQAIGFDSSLNAFFDWCRSNDDDCGFASGGDPAVAYERVIAGIDAEPLPAEVNGERRTLGPGEADLGVAQTLYAGSAGWPTLGGSLALAAQGDGSALLELSDSYTRRQPNGEYSGLMVAFYAISCIDMPPPATVDDVERLAAATATKAPNFGEANAWLGLPCTYWPVPPDGAPAPVSAPGAPPIVVIGTTNDPATPLSGATALADQLPDARLVVFEGEGHTAYGRSDCVDDAVDEYLLTLNPPPDGMRCS